MSQLDIEGYLKTLPNLPGVYRFLDKDGQVLYVGKAVNLKRRVASYFQKNGLSPRIALMVRQIDSIEVSLTRSETEALILENNFIKSLAPKYNILFRDDKSYPYLMFSGHEFPQMAYYRGNLDKQNRYFGPYPNGQAVRDSIGLLQKVFLLRTCEDSVFAHRDRACLLHQIKRCSAPCVGAIDPPDYQKQITRAADFLAGKTDVLVQDLTAEMQQAAERLEFEHAARCRDQIQALNRVQSQQFIDVRQGKANNIDILALLAQDGGICLHWVSIRGGRRVGEKSFFPDTCHALHENSEAYGQAFVAQHYLGRPKPEVIVSNFDLPSDLQTALNDEAGHKIQFVRPTSGERKVWLQMAEQNAALALLQKSQQKQNQNERISALAELLRLPEAQIRRLECFDISHTQGEATVAGCVVYEAGAMQPDQYRHYRITQAKAGDDYAAMREVLLRRYGKLLESEGIWPDVVLIDGGKGQIGVACEVWRELGIDLPLVGIAKGVERKAGQETLILVQQNRELQLPPHHPALHLLQTVRDESHRFAITGHRRARAKARFASSLEEIDGIGPKRRRSLLTRFGGLRGIQAAGVEELAQTEGISRALAEKIHAAFHG